MSQLSLDLPNTFPVVKDFIAPTWKILHNRKILQQNWDRQHASTPARQPASTPARQHASTPAQPVHRATTITHPQRRPPSN
jgi:hypothetical protein